MKKIFVYLSILAGVALLIVSCNETLRIDNYEHPTPTIASFSPLAGPVGTLITVKGHGLNDIRTARINGAGVVIKHLISGVELVLETTTAGSTGIITLEGSAGEAQGAEVFTYTYPTPVITNSPSSCMVGELAVFFGVGMDAVLDVKFNATEAQIVEKRSTELVVKVPDLSAAKANITFTYYDGSKMVTLAKTDVGIARGLPIVTLLSPLTGIVAGAEVTATGRSLHLVEKVMIGQVEARIISQPKHGLTLTFKVADDLLFADGSNTCPLVFYAFDDTEVLNVDENFTFEMPKFYIWKNANLNAHSIYEENHFFGFDTGNTYSALDFATQVDPLTMSLGGTVCSAKNQLAASVTEKQYYDIKPYIYFAYLGSGCYFYGPANSNNRISNFKNLNPDLGGTIYGTPIILYRTLSTANAAENAIVTKIKNGTFSNDDFSPDLLDNIDLTQTGASTEDGWSNVPVGDLAAFREVSATNHRPWAPTLPGATDTVDIDPGTVVLVMYCKPAWSTFSVSKANIRKFGFIEITRLEQDKALELGRQNNATFNAYWQRTPMGN